MNPNQRLPAVDRVLQQIPDLIETHGRQLVTGSVRAELAAAREGLKHGLPLPDEAALLVAPTDTAELAAALVRVLTDAALAGELRAKGLARARELTWDAAVALAVAAYRLAARTSLSTRTRASNSTGLDR